ncbi:MAG TPA: hypothetical protein VF017_03375 [Thermoanaerobaculia bacterium]|nr:hypothetical protein [Thermoanaerobaculia bacterium]
MAQGLPGADSSQPVTMQVVEAATQLFGRTPVLWGRYFTSATTSGTVEYHHATESSVLAQYGIRLLPIARQTENVGGSKDQGVADAQGNVVDVVDSFGASYLSSLGGQFLMFLDVEGVPSSGSPSLSLDYYLGWAETLVAQSQALTGGAATILPCVYARQGDSATWNVLVSALGQGATCAGAWVARYDPGTCELADWNDTIVMPAVSLPFPILLWQYAENCCQGAIDANQTNPGVDVQGLLLDRLILPVGG